MLSHYEVRISIWDLFPFEQPEQSGNQLNLICVRIAASTAAILEAQDRLHFPLPIQEQTTVSGGLISKRHANRQGIGMRRDDAKENRNTEPAARRA